MHRNDMQQQHQAHSTTSTSILLDAPCPWLGQLISGQYLDSASKFSLFHTCKQLNDKVMQHSHSTSLSLDLLSRPFDNACGMLQRASKHASRIRLRLHDGGYNGNDAKQVARTIVNLLQTASGFGATNAVTELHLEGAFLETILPPFVGQACHNLTKLSLQECKFAMDRAISFSKDFQNLQSLEINHCYYYSRSADSDGPSRCDTQADSDEQADSLEPAHSTPNPGMQHMHAQLTCLTALCSLTFINGGQETAFELQYSIINALAPQLTHLCFDMEQVDEDEPSVEYNLKPVKWVQLGAALQHLQLPGVWVGDEAMHIFLKMPCLIHLRLHTLNLEESFAGQPCKWEELVCSDISIQALAYLPLHAGLVLKVVGSEDDTPNLFMQPTETSTHLVQQAVVNVQGAKALEWGERSVFLCLTQWYRDPPPPSRVAELLAHAIPLLRSVKNLSMNSGHLNQAGMQAFQDVLQDRTDEPCIKFDRVTHGQIGDLAALMGYMPHNSTIQVDVDLKEVEDNSEQQIIQLCCAAKCRLTLKAQVRDRQTVCEQRIRSAIQACGLEVTGLHIRSYMGIHGPVDVTVQPGLTSLP